MIDLPNVDTAYAAALDAIESEGYVPTGEIRHVVRLSVRAGFEKGYEAGGTAGRDHRRALAAVLAKCRAIRAGHDDPRGWLLADEIEALIDELGNNEGEVA